MIGTTKQYVFDDADQVYIETGDAEITDKLRLKVLDDELEFPEDFADDTGHTYDSSLLEFKDGGVEQKNKRPTNAIFYAPFTNDENAAWSNGVGTGTLQGGATVSGGTLDCEAANEYCEFVNTGNVGLNAGTVDLRLSVPYNGNPASNNYLYCEALGAGSSNHNAIYLFHQSSGLIQLYAFNNAGYSILTKNLGAWSPTADQIYTFSLNYDFSGDVRLFIDGVQQGTTGNPSDVRTSFAGKILLGTGITLAENSYTKYYDVLIFDSVQHTENYTPDWTGVYEYDYIESSDILPAMQYTGLGTLISFDDFDLTYEGAPRITLKIRETGEFVYWNGLAWVTSDSTYDQATPIPTFIVKCPLLPVEGETWGQFQIHFPDSNTQSSVSALLAYLTAQTYSTDTQKISMIDTFRQDEIYSVACPYTENTNTYVRLFFRLNSQAYWYNPTSGEVEESDESIDQANTITEFQNIIQEYEASTTQFVILLKSDDGIHTPEVPSLTISYSQTVLEVEKNICEVEFETGDIDMEDPAELTVNVKLYNPSGTYNGMAISDFEKDYTSEELKLSIYLLQTAGMDSPDAHYIFSWLANEESGNRIIKKKVIAASEFYSTLEDLTDYDDSY
jgi:hypothetical protein